MTEHKAAHSKRAACSPAAQLDRLAGPSRWALELFIHCVPLARTHRTVGEVTTSDEPQCTTLSWICAFMIYGIILFLTLSFNYLFPIK